MAGILKISEAVALAIHACVLVASADDGRLSASDIAEKLAASENHLAKVLRRLVRAGLIKSSRGPGGGFSLAAGTDEISLLDIYEAVDGSFPRGECLFSAPACKGPCLLRDLLSKVNRQVSGYFEKTTLADLT